MFLGLLTHRMPALSLALEITSDIKSRLLSIFAGGSEANSAAYSHASNSSKTFQSDQFSILLNNCTQVLLSTQQLMLSRVMYHFRCDFEMPLHLQSSEKAPIPFANVKGLDSSEQIMLRQQVSM